MADNKVIKFPKMCSEDEIIQRLLNNLYVRGCNNTEITLIILAYLETKGLVKQRKAS